MARNGLIFSDADLETEIHVYTQNKKPRCLEVHVNNAKKKFSSI